MTASATHTKALPLVPSLLGSRSIVQDAALIVGGALFVGALAQTEVPLWPVPITGQTLGVVLVGALLGSRRGAMAMVTYAIAGLAGLPLFAGFTGGPLMIMKPSFGFIIGFIGAAWVAGLVAERGWDRNFWKASLGFLVASVIPFLVGVPYLGVVLSSAGATVTPELLLAAGVTPFIVGGIVKALLAGALVPLAWRGARALSAGKRS